MSEGTTAPAPKPTTTGYGSISIPPSADEERTAETGFPRRWRLMWYYLTVFTLLLVMVMIVGRVVSLILRRQSPSQQPPPMMRVQDSSDTGGTSAGSAPLSASRCRLCTFRECENDHCPHLMYPAYICTRGVASNPTPGCSKNSHEWINNPNCEDCCSTEFCWLLTKPSSDDDTPSCPGCSFMDCREFGHTCPFIYPFVCTGGASTNGELFVGLAPSLPHSITHPSSPSHFFDQRRPVGCTGDPYEWSNNPACATCCDLGTCWGFR